MEMLKPIFEFATAYGGIITAAVALCSAIAAITPSKSDDRIVQFVLDVVNKIGLNIGKARNADDV